MNETQALIDGLRAKYPGHIVALCTNGNVGRWVEQRYWTGKADRHTGKGRKLVRHKILLAVYPPTFKLQ